MDIRSKKYFLVAFALVLMIQDGRSFPFKILGNAIEGEYLLLCRHHYSTESKSQFFSKLEQKLGIVISPFLDVPFGKYRAYLLRNLTAEHVEFIRTQEGSEMIEANRLVRAVATSYKTYIHEADPPSNVSSPVTFCYEQNTGRNLWGLSRINQRNKLGRSGRYQWSFDDDGTGVDVYVIDSGCNIDHEEFGGRAKRGFTATQLSNKEGAEDLNGHGTHVSGTIAGTTFGVAKAANIIAVKALDKNGIGSIADIVEGLAYIYRDFVENGKTRAVINLSLGSLGTSVALENTIDLCINAGINVVVASGNDFDDSCLYTPAHVTKALTIASSNVEDAVSSFSNFGSCIDLFAPGESIISAYIGGRNAYAISDGTSMASPHVAGAIARYLSHSTTLVPSPADVALYFDTISTRGAIDFSILPVTQASASTPNKFLYVECSRATRIYSGSPRINPLTVIYYVVVVLFTYCCGV